MTRRLSKILVAALIALFAVTSPAQAATSHTSANGCKVSLDTPHWSSSGGTVLVKARFSCPPGASRTWKLTGQVLFRNGAGVYQGNNQNVTVGSGGSVTRYIPPTNVKITPRGTYFARLHFYFGTDPEVEFIITSPSKPLNSH